MEPKIAIIILNWNRPKLTSECVRSVLNNAYQCFQIFLVDNGSTDNSNKMFTNEFGKNQRVSILQTHRNLGYTGGNNYGFKKAIKNKSFDFVCILNNDTIVDRYFLKTLVKSAKVNGENHLYFPLILGWQSEIIQSGGLTDYLPTPFQFKYRGYARTKIVQIEESRYLQGCCFLIKTELFQKTGGFDEKYFMYGEDIDLGLRLKNINIKFYLVPQAVIWHYGATKMTPLSTYYSTRNSLMIIRQTKASIQKKLWETFRALFWLALLSLKYSIIQTDLAVILTYLKGVRDYLSNKQGEQAY